MGGETVEPAALIPPPPCPSSPRTMLRVTRLLESDNDPPVTSMPPPSGNRSAAVAVAALRSISALTSDVVPPRETIPSAPPRGVAAHDRPPDGQRAIRRDAAAGRARRIAFHDAVVQRERRALVHQDAAALAGSWMSAADGEELEDGEAAAAEVQDAVVPAIRPLDDRAAWTRAPDRDGASDVEVTRARSVLVRPEPLEDVRPGGGQHDDVAAGKRVRLLNGGPQGAESRRSSA